jgi:hypothetical protein
VTTSSTVRVLVSLLPDSVHCEEKDGLLVYEGPMKELRQLWGERVQMHPLFGGWGWYSLEVASKAAP